MDFDRLQADVFQLHAGEHYADALARVEEAAAALPEHAATLAYWRACLLARTGDHGGAVTILRERIDAGDWYAEEVLRTDEDLGELQGEASFEGIVAICAEREAHARAAGPQPPLVLTPDAVDIPAPLLLAFHRAASSPHRSAAQWRAAAEAGWLVSLPHGPRSLGSESRAWLTGDRQALDLDAAADEVNEALGHVRATRAVDTGRVVCAGFAQGGAVALGLALRGAVDAVGVFAVGATFRLREVVDGLDGAAEGLRRVHLLVGEGERHVDAAREAAAALDTCGIHASLDVRLGLGHAFPDGFADELPALLDGLVAGRRPLR